MWRQLRAARPQSGKQLLFADTLLRNGKLSHLLLFLALCPRCSRATSFVQRASVSIPAFFAG
jgi:hypothetical protein